MHKQNNGFASIPTLVFKILVLNLVHNKFNEAQVLLVIDVVRLYY